MKDQIYIFLVLAFALTAKAQWTPDPFCPYPSDHVTRYPYYGNCSVYWECYAGTKYVMECPEGLEFNAPLQECDSPEIAKCDPFASTTENPNPPTYTTVSTTSHQPGPECPYPSDELIYYPYPGDCTKYWECFAGNSYLYNCPAGLWWHQEISQCDYPGDFCNNSTVTSTETTSAMTTTSTTRMTTTTTSFTTTSTTTDDVTTSTSTTTQSWTPDCSEAGGDPVYYPYEGDCTKYYECSNGKLYEYTCPDGLWWHQSISQCDYPGDFCSDDIPVCDPNSDEATYYPFVGNCSKYWECFKGELFNYTCPDDLWWHQEILNCDYPGSYCTSEILKL